MKKYLPLAGLLVTVGTSIVHAEPPSAGGKPPAGWQAQREERHAAFDAALSKLPADKAAMVKDSFKKGRESGKANWEKIRALHEEEKAILLAPTFDKSAFLAKSAEISKLHDQQAADRANSMADVASKLNASERKIVMDAFEQMHPKGPGPHGGGAK